MGTFEYSLRHLIKSDQDEKLWQLYLHSHQSKSFKDWKRELLENQKQNPNTMTDEEITTQVKKAKNLLSMMKGGQA